MFESQAIIAFVFAAALLACGTMATTLSQRYMMGFSGQDQHYSFPLGVRG